MNTMIRVFTTSFEFQGRTYSSMVQMTIDKSDFAMQISVEDPSLYSLLPDGKISYTSKSGLKTNIADKKLQAQELVGSVVRSVEKHLYS
jgi:hypothetical protein